MSGGTTVPGNRWDLVGDRTPPPTTVTVVVTHFEQPLELARTLHALTRQTHPRELLEVVVVDDGSRTPPQLPAGVRLERQEDRGFRAAAARNLGARVATGDVLVFLDADTTPEPDLVRRLIRLPALLPDALVVGRRRHADLAALPVDAPVETAGPLHELTSPRWLQDGYAATRDLLDADESSFRYVISAVASCRRDLHELVGGFDETFTDYGGEDWDWAYRAWNHGALLAHEPRAVAWHDGPHRGERDAGLADDLVAARESLAIAARIPVDIVSPPALLLGAPDPVVTVDAGLSGPALVITLDSLLAAWPRSRVLVSGTQATWVGADPRVEVSDDPGTDPGTGPAWRHLHLHAAVRGDVSAWQAPGRLLGGAGAPGGVRVLGADGRPLLQWRARRARRRAQRWGRSDLFEERDLPAKGLTRVDPATSVAGYVGGWS